MKKYLLALAAAALCLGLVASCDKDDEKGKVSVVTVVEQDTLLTEAGTPKFLVGGWISEGEMKFYTTGVDDTTYKYYFLYVDEKGEGEMGYDEFEERIEGLPLWYPSKYHNYRSFRWIKQDEDGGLKALMEASMSTYPATITSRTDSTLTLEPFFGFDIPKTLKKTAVRPHWR